MPIRAYTVLCCLVFAPLRLLRCCVSQGCCCFGEDVKEAPSFQPSTLFLKHPAARTPLFRLPLPSSVRLVFPKPDRPPSSDLPFSSDRAHPFFFLSPIGSEPPHPRRIRSSPCVWLRLCFWCFYCFFAGCVSSCFGVVVGFGLPDLRRPPFQYGRIAGWSLQLEWAPTGFFS